MIYELRAAAKSLRRDGVAGFARRVWVYIRHLFGGVILLCKPRREFAQAEQSVDYALNAAGGVIRPWQVRSEIVSLASLVRQAQPKVVVEIGTAMGGTLFLWCANAALDAVIVSIDLPNGDHGGGYPYWKTFLYRSFARPRQEVFLFRGDSHSSEMLGRLESALNGRQIDYLFIDGDHTYEGAKKDFESYSPLVRHGGIIALHDVAAHTPGMHCEVDRYWDELKSTRSHREFIAEAKQGWAGIGVIFT